VRYNNLSLTKRFCLHSSSRCCPPNLRNRAKFRENSYFKIRKLSKFIDLGANRTRLVVEALTHSHTDYDLRVARVRTETARRWRINISLVVGDSRASCQQPSILTFWKLETLPRRLHSIWKMLIG